MNFNSAAFLAFLVLVYGVHRIWPAGWWRGEKLFLLAASYVFYGWFEPRYTVLLLASTVVDWFCGRHLAGAGRGRRAVVTISIVVNLGLLAFFKYGDFALANAAALTGWQRPLWRIALPIGISFYTFQSMSYTIDLYRRRIEPFERFTDFALFVSLFPQLVAGPIVRAAELRDQLRRKRPFRWPKFSWGLFLILLGFFHKSVLADNLAGLSDAYFASSDGSESAAVAWFGVYAFAGQIYCDFAGYSWIAIGIAHLFGWRFPQNFDHPYLATRFADFWRRWHRTLSRFLRDYLYIPLGGNRHGARTTARNLLLTMAIGGLWHGAAWTFVAWGVLHGLYLVAERVLERRRPLPLPPAVRRIVVFHGVCLAWVFFRARTFEQASRILVAMTTHLSTDGFRLVEGHAFLAAAAAVHLVGLVPRRRRRLAFGWYLAASALMLLALLRLRGDPGAFLYFQF